MCKETFLRLPEEKRARILNAAWEEFTEFPFTKASINRIIRRADIPRGSFYQYFDDKSDIFQYLIRQIHDQMTDYYRRLLVASGGNLFASALMGYDRFLAEQTSGTNAHTLERCIRLVRINPGMDLESFGRRYRPDKEKLMESFMDDMNLTPFRRQDKAFILQVCCIVGMCLISALMDCLLCPGEKAERRKALWEELDILRRGSYTETALRNSENEKGGLL